MQQIEKQRVKTSFHRQSGEYENHARVQPRIASRIADLVSEDDNRRIGAFLDVGCGTGKLVRLLSLAYPDASAVALDIAYSMTSRVLANRHHNPSIHPVNGDAEHLPFHPESFDLVVSSSALQWVTDLEGSVRECCRVLRPEGRFCIAFFGEGTLEELRSSYVRAVIETGADRKLLDRLHPFVSRDTVKMIADSLPFDEIVLFSDEEREYYSDVPSLLTAIKGIGAGSTAKQGGGKGLGWRRIVSEMSRFYGENFGTSEGIPATYRVFYLIGRGYRGSTTR